MVNDYSISNPPEPPHDTTGWIIRAAGEGRPRMTQAAFRSMTRRSQPSGPLPLPVVQGPVVGDRPEAFVLGATAGTGRQFRPSLAGGVLGAIAGVAARNAYKNWRR